MNGLTRKQAGISGASAMALGLALILVPTTATPHAVAVAATVPTTAATSAVPTSSAASSSPAAASPDPAPSAPASSPASAPPPSQQPAPTGAPQQPASSGPASSPASKPSSSAKASSAAPPKPTTSSSIKQPVDPLPISVGPTATKSIPPSSNCSKSTGWRGDAFSPIGGTDHDTCRNIPAENTADDAARGGGQDVGPLADGAWARYMMVDFGTGATQFYGRVASGAAAGISGRVQVHLDKLDGPVVSVFEIANTGGWQSWRTVPMNMNKTSGVHDVYLTFDSGQPQPFVSLHWFDFGN